ncbi:MAG: NAD-dependent epimerase/dehydratase family protein [Beijerinckiaceae bacterium]
MNVVVTGAGLVATAYAREAIAKGCTVTFIDPEPRADYLRFKLGEKGWKLVRKDIRDLPGLVEAFRDSKADAVVHTAGLIGSRVQQSLFNGFEINLVGSRNVAEAVRLAGVKRLVHISTMGVYDTRRKTTANVPEDFPRGANRGYGNYKAAIEMVMEAYADQYKFELLILRPANVYGFGHFFAGSSGGMKMQALVEAAIDGAAARVQSSETMANEYIYSRDTGRAVEIATTIAMPKDYIFNIGNGYVSTFDQVLDALGGVGKVANIEVEPGDPPKSKAHAMDIGRAAAQLGWAPKYSLAEGFRDYADEVRAARAFFGR